MPNNGKDWGKVARRYARADWRRPAWQFATTVPPMLFAWWATWQLSLVSWWLVPPVSLVGSLLLMRCFIIQHDCGHTSWSPSQRVNNWVGRFPYLDGRVEETRRIYTP